MQHTISNAYRPRRQAMRFHGWSCLPRRNGGLNATSLAWMLNRTRCCQAVYCPIQARPPAAKGINPPRVGIAVSPANASDLAATALRSKRAIFRVARGGVAIFRNGGGPAAGLLEGGREGPGVASSSPWVMNTRRGACWTLASHSSSFSRFGMRKIPQCGIPAL